MTAPVLTIESLNKEFLIHAQGSQRIPVFEGLRLEAFEGECVSLRSPSGTGKSSLLRCLYGCYRLGEGSRVLLRKLSDEVIDLAQLDASGWLRLRRSDIAMVSQFFRPVPRVSCLRLVTEPFLSEGLPKALAEKQAQDLLTRLAIPAPLWQVAPRTFSGGEQQRVNLAVALASSLVKPRRLLLLDEPTAALDPANAQRVLGLLNELKEQGCCLIGAFHSEAIEQSLQSRVVILQSEKGGLG
ncbi:MAG: ATP-binding cassette domain-containing protein [Burkholderiaceae bacterium]